MNAPSEQAQKPAQRETFRMFMHKLEPIESWTMCAGDRLRRDAAASLRFGSTEMSLELDGDDQDKVAICLNGWVIVTMINGEFAAVDPAPTAAQALKALGQGLSEGFKAIESAMKASGIPQSKAGRGKFRGGVRRR